VAADEIVHEVKARRRSDDAELIERLVERLGGAEREPDRRAARSGVRTRRRPELD